jgi:hypothetical protein
MITEPTLQIELKGIDSMEAPNRLSIVAASNEAWAVPVEAGDRRWAVFKTNDRYAYKECDATKREAYFTPLYKQMKKDGLEAMLYDLLRRKVSAAQIRDVPNTEEKAQLKSLSLPSTEAWIEMILQEGEIPPLRNMSIPTTWSEDGLVIGKDLAYESYAEFCKACGIRRQDARNVWSRTLCRILKEALNPEYGKPRKFKFGPLSRCRELFDHAVGNEPGGGHWAPSPETVSAHQWKPQPIHAVVELEKELSAA